MATDTISLQLSNTLAVSDAIYFLTGKPQDLAKNLNELKKSASIKVLAIVPYGVNHVCYFSSNDLRVTDKKNKSALKGE